LDLTPKKRKLQIGELEMEESKTMKMTQISEGFQFKMFKIQFLLLLQFKIQFLVFLDNCLLIKLIGGNVGNAGKQDKSPIVFNF
jgi:hypothetical protein